VIRRGAIIVIAVMLLVATWCIARSSVRAASSLFSRGLENKLLRDVAACFVVVPVFMLGLSVVLTVSGLTGLAVTVVGGTGLVGLVIGLRFATSPRIFWRVSSSACSGHSPPTT
jgi:hypothetical protein